MLTRDHELLGFGQAPDPNGGYVLLFKGTPIYTQAEEEALGPLADGVWAAFLRQRRTLIDRDGEVE